MATTTKKVVKLRIKVPANVTVVTELVPTAASLSLDSPLPGRTLVPSASPTTMEMDLTSAKTADWLKKKLVVSSDCGNCCCVRG
ncbi:hypothetical protein [Piscinibacter sakaiensis]|uniref:Uncharacterized protein n=1 Tax=Piscinibacter sakaiensis TaxID=1547922 RepID=A0A0K8P113_PISS1|nr:hypothetical protein [Piscinibacter sakaiensis]GAP36224.1 hypothetical protein ISF6_2064 [Piscinibacter sakaiensis]